MLASLVAACGGVTPSPTTTPASVPPSADDAAARGAYAEAICPLLIDIATLDPRLAAMRGAGAEGGDMTVHAAELELLAEELRRILNGLEAVPDWGPGQRLQFELVTALHAIRTQILIASRDLERFDAADGLAAIPFVASEILDRAMATATTAGLTCAEG
jgi:hypothetical protein